MSGSRFVCWLLVGNEGMEKRIDTTFDVGLNVSLSGLLSGSILAFPLTK